MDKHALKHNGGSKGAPGAPRPSDQIFLDFLQFQGKRNKKNVSRRPSPKIGALSCENPGSATEACPLIFKNIQK